MNRKKILVLGSTGMAGHVVTTFFEERKDYDVFNLARKKLNKNTYICDASDFIKFENFLDKYEFDVIINCIGILNHYVREKKTQAILMNSYLPNFLENKYKKARTKIIHISTDCVFSGNTGSYTEFSLMDGDSFYGRTKALGEIISGRNLTIRTSVIGPEINCEGVGLFNWFMKSRGKIDGYIDAIWTGITTIELAKAIEKAILYDTSGLYHLVPDKSISKFGLLKLFKEFFNKNNIEITQCSSVKFDRSLINSRSDFDYTVPDYDIMIFEMKNWISGHESFYTHYIVP